MCMRERERERESGGCIWAGLLKANRKPFSMRFMLFAFLHFH